MCRCDPVSLAHPAGFARDAIINPSPISYVGLAAGEPVGQVDGERQITTPVGGYRRAVKGYFRDLHCTFEPEMDPLSFPLRIGDEVFPIPGVSEIMAGTIGVAGFQAYRVRKTDRLPFCRGWNRLDLR